MSKTTKPYQLALDNGTVEEYDTFAEAATAAVNHSMPVTLRMLRGTHYISNTIEIPSNCTIYEKNVPISPLAKEPR